MLWFGLLSRIPNQDTFIPKTLATQLIQLNNFTNFYRSLCPLLPHASSLSRPLFGVSVAMIECATHVLCLLCSRRLHVRLHIVNNARTYGDVSSSSGAAKPNWSEKGYTRTSRRTPERETEETKKRLEKVIGFHHCGRTGAEMDMNEILICLSFTCSARSLFERPRFLWETIKRCV